MFRRTKQGLLALASLVVLSAACESGTGPEEEATFDADAVLADFETMDLVLQSDAMEGFRALGAGISFHGVAPGEPLALKVGGELVAPRTAEGAGKFARRILSEASELGSGALKAPIISQFRRGKTFVYDPGLGRYVVDEELAGAPDTGVRFILYRAGPDGKPDPANQIGHADLIDEGDGSVEDIALRLVVVEATDTVLDYRTTLDVLEDGGTITVAGFLQGETDRLNFDITVTGSEGDEADIVDIGFDIWLQEAPLTIQGTVSGVESDSGEGGHVSLLVTHGDDSFSVDVEVADDSTDGTIKLNGGDFAFITGDPDEPTITNAQQEPLTWAEMLVLRQILDSTEDVFDLWEDLLDPMDELVILALIL